ncbi:MAG: hypothetical protein U9N81_01160 [Bacillota bacterium]|nr:hypothetical protein [Bacillota bacterium]
MEAIGIACKPKAIIHNHAFPITNERVYDAMITVDEMGKRVKQGLPIA